MKDDGFFARDTAAKITLATRKWRLPNSPSSFDDFLINERTLQGEIFIAVTQRAWTIMFSTFEKLDQIQEGSESWHAVTTAPATKTIDAAFHSLIIRKRKLC